MWLTDTEQRALLDETDPITNRINKAVQVAIKTLGLGKVPEDLERIFEIAEKIDRRAEQQAKAEFHAAKAYSNTLGTETGLSKE